jgi:hypothetical protein
MVAVVGMPEVVVGTLEAVVVETLAAVAAVGLG